MGTSSIEYKKPTSSFAIEKGTIVYQDGKSFETDLIINIDKITMLARKGDDKTLIYLVSGEYIILNKPFAEVEAYIGNCWNCVKSITLSEND